MIPMYLNYNWCALHDTDSTIIACSKERGLLWLRDGDSVLATWSKRWFFLREGDSAIMRLKEWVYIREGEDWVIRLFGFSLCRTSSGLSLGRVTV